MVDTVGKGGAGGRVTGGQSSPFLGRGSIVTGRKSTVSPKSKKPERRKKGKDLKTWYEQFEKSSPGRVDRRKLTKDAAKANKQKITKEDVASHVKATKAREEAAKEAVKKRIAREDREAAERKGLDFRKTSSKPSRAPSRAEIEMELTKMRERDAKLE